MRNTKQHNIQSLCIVKADRFAGSFPLMHAGCLLYFSVSTSS